MVNSDVLEDDMGRILTLEKARASKAFDALSMKCTDIIESRSITDILWGLGIDHIHQLVEQDPKILFKGLPRGPAKTVTIEHYLRKVGLDLGLQLADDLKNALGLPLVTSALVPRASKKPPKLPTREQLEEKRAELLAELAKLNYKLNNYDDIKDGKLPFSPLKD